MNTSELIGSVLDEIVAKCLKYSIGQTEITEGLTLIKNEWISFSPSIDANQGVPIIESEGIGLWRKKPGMWVALYQGIPYQQIGPTLLVAAMRCYVAKTIGDHVEFSEK